jgi:hypothetical protein
MMQDSSGDDEKEEITGYADYANFFISCFYNLCKSV